MGLFDFIKKDKKEKVDKKDNKGKDKSNEKKAKKEEENSQKRFKKLSLNRNKKNKDYIDFDSIKTISPEDIAIAKEKHLQNDKRKPEEILKDETFKEIALSH
ncbi:hypothetical protein [uncultured Methanobrevibacter sp.]|uniref:hypothetical protein n=1 Tax=uncultured Methanobrevibacter sp. TaxID=253161 RepID=UPI0025EC37B3|nr:hypothetical protein [uncultured Methanobrevibacter sp.]